MAKIAVLGYGTVGSGVVEVLSTNSSSIATRAGQPIEVKSVLDIRDFPGDPIQEKIVHDIDDIVNVWHNYKKQSQTAGGHYNVRDSQHRCRR